MPSPRRKQEIFSSESEVARCIQSSNNRFRDGCYFSRLYEGQSLMFIRPFWETTNFKRAFYDFAKICALSEIVLALSEERTFSLKSGMVFNLMSFHLKNWKKKICSEQPDIVALHGRFDVTSNAARCLQQNSKVALPQIRTPPSANGTWVQSLQIRTSSISIICQNPCNTQLNRYTPSGKCHLLRRRSAYPYNRNFIFGRLQ